MKLLILNGSARKNGTVASLLKEVSKNLDGKVEQEWIDVYALNMKPCIGCRGCRKNDSDCVLPRDDAHFIGEKMRDAEALLIGTPTHFNNMSSPLKNLLDRNGTTLFTEPPSGMPIPKHKGKPAAMVTACMTPRPLSSLLGMTRGTLKSLKIYLKYGGFKIVGSLVKTGSGKNPEIDASLKKKARRLSHKLLMAAA